MVQALLVTGDTYTRRRDLKALGGKWFPDRQGWVIPTDKAEEVEALISRQDDPDTLSVETIEVESEALETPTGDRLRAIRQDKIDRRADRLEAKAGRLGREAAAKTAAVPGYADDYAYITQPHVPGREKIMDRKHRALQMSAEAQDVAAEAQRLRGTRALVKGDTERRRQAKREALDKIIKPGTRITTHTFGSGTVTRIYKKSYGVKFDRLDRVISVEKSFAMPIPVPPPG